MPSLLGFAGMVAAAATQGTSKDLPNLYQIHLPNAPDHIVSPRVQNLISDETVW